MPKKMTLLKPGHIIIIDFLGAEGVKRRPSVVISSERYRATRPDVIVGMITTKVASATMPSDCLLQDWESARLYWPSAFRTYLFTEIQSEASAPVGRLSDRDWKAVCAAMKRGLAVLEDS